MELQLVSKNHNQHGEVLALHSAVRPQTFFLEEDTCTIGRAPICQIVISRSTVSRVHARIERDSLRYMLRDADSANGTFVNGRRVHEPRMLRHRDMIGLGSAEALLRFIDPDPTIESLGRLRYDEQTMSFLLDQQEVDLPPNQLRLLRHLYQHIGTVCKRESCAQAIWGQEYDPVRDAGALDRAINRLRGIMRRADDHTEFITTVRGVGYMLNNITPD